LKSFNALTIKYFHSLQSKEVKQNIIDLPSARYIKELKPGKGQLPSKWQKTTKHAELFLKFLYEDYLKASG